MTQRECDQATVDALELFREYKRAPGEALRNSIVVRYLHIAKIIARRFSGKGVDFDDLYQVASLALIKAVERFDPDYGVLFQSYATPKMVGEVKNYFRDKLHMLNLPRRAAQLSKQIDAARQDLAQKLARQPTMAELAQHTGLPEAEVIEALALRGAMYPGSLDAQPDDESSPMSAFLGVDDTDYDRFELRESIEALLLKLPEMERRILRARFWEERSQRDVADEIGVSQMTVSRAERKALTMIKELMSE